MNAIRSLLVVTVVLVAGIGLPAVAADKPKDVIVGKWEPVDDKSDSATIEFLKDGRLKITAILGTMKLSYDGTYKFVDDNNIETEPTFQGKTTKDKLKVEVTKDTLTTTDSTGRADKLRRVK